MLPFLKRLMDRYGAPDWRFAHRLWTIQAALFWAAVSGAWMAVPSFQSMLTPYQYSGLCIVMSLVICVGRLTNQPGVPNE